MSSGLLRNVVLLMSLMNLAFCFFKEYYSWLPELDGEALIDDACLRVDQFQKILDDKSKTKSQKAEETSRFTCRKSANLECEEENICKCMKFGNDSGEWNEERLKCYHPLGGKCTTRLLLFPGMPARILFKPMCIQFAKCASIHPLSNDTCECDEDLEAEPDEARKECIVHHSHSGSGHVTSSGTLFYFILLASI